MQMIPECMGAPLNIFMDIACKLISSLTSLSQLNGGKTGWNHSIHPNLIYCLFIIVIEPKLVPVLMSGQKPQRGTLSRKATEAKDHFQSQMEPVYSCHRKIYWKNGRFIVEISWLSLPCSESDKTVNGVLPLYLNWCGLVLTVHKEFKRAYATLWVMNYSPPPPATIIPQLKRR